MTPELTRLLAALETAAYNLGKAEARGMIRNTDIGPRADVQKRREALVKAIEASSRKP